MPYSCNHHVYLVEFIATTERVITNSNDMHQALTEMPNRLRFGITSISEFRLDKMKFVKMSKKDIKSRFDMDTAVFLLLQKAGIIK